MIQLNVEYALTNVSIAIIQQTALLAPRTIMSTPTILLVLCVQMQQQQVIMDAVNA